ncbi:MAG: hypothetical protein Fur0010_28620 [Bdellovibrio sp.]
MMKLFFAILFLFSNSIHAMDIDSKFVARVLGVSDSKKTILINKGSESGLKEGDHAIMSLPSGAVARGVVAKLSPSRSVWSIYRFYDADKLMPNVALTVKIASAVKLSDDESKALGALAPDYGTKTSETIPEDQTSTGVKKAQEVLAKDFKQSERLGQFDNSDYSNLEDNMIPQPLDPDIDWSGLDGKKDMEKVDPSTDYSNLK